MFRYILFILKEKNPDLSPIMKFLVVCVFFHLMGINQTVISKSNPMYSKMPSGDNVSENSLLWKIERSDRPTSYLFGTFHLLPLSDFEMKDKVLTAFELTDQVVLEIDMDDPAMQRDFMAHVTRNDTRTLETALSSEDFRKLDAILTGTFGMTAKMFNHWHPAMVGTFLIKYFIEGEPASYDASLLALANEKNREVLGLESMEDQLKIFEKIPYDDQIKDLKEMLTEEAKVKGIFSQMIASYKDEDIDGLHNLLLQSIGNKQKADLLLNNRNRSWIPRIDELTSGNASFIAVGAGHLAGKDGLVNRLRREGFTVTPVK